MEGSVKLLLAMIGGLGLAGLVLWWFADHRRGIAWAIAIVRDCFPDVAHLSASELGAWLRGGHHLSPQLVDVRSASEYAASHLPGARWIDPESSITSALAMLDPGRPAVVYSSAGYRAARFARRLQRAGRRDVWNLAGGIFAWANLDLPVERDGLRVRVCTHSPPLFSRLLKPRHGK